MHDEPLITHSSLPHSTGFHARMAVPRPRCNSTTCINSVSLGQELQVSSNKHGPLVRSLKSSAKRCEIKVISTADSAGITV